MKKTNHKIGYMQKEQTAVKKHCYLFLFCRPNFNDKGHWLCCLKFGGNCDVTAQTGAVNVGKSRRDEPPCFKVGKGANKTTSATGAYKSIQIEVKVSIQGEKISFRANNKNLHKKLIYL